MKIVIAADIFPPQPGGPATYSATLANELTKSGNEICVVSLNPNSDAAVVPCRVYSVSWKNKLFRYLQYALLLYKHEKGAGVIYAMGPVNAGLPALIVAKLRRKKLFVKVVGDYAWEQWQNANAKANSQNLEFVRPEDFSKIKVGLKIRVLKYIERIVTKKANKVVVPSQYLKKIVMAWGVKSENIEVIYNAVEFKTVESIKHGNEKWLVSVGRLVPWKGFDTLIEIMSILIKEFPDLKLKIIGSGPEMENYKLQIKKYELGACVELLGGLSREKTLSYIKSADIFVLNTGYEGLSHVILEALYCAVPILASSAGGNPELLNEENLFNYNNKEEIAQKILAVLKKEMVFISDNQGFDQFKFEAMIDNTKKVLCVS